MIPREYFNDELSMGVSNGAYEHLKKSRFTIINLPVGYGKTIISMLTCVKIAKDNGGKIQLGIIAPKSKRLDNSFIEAIESASYYFGVEIEPLIINNELIGTFAGIERIKNKKEEFKEFEKSILSKPTIIILDETHMRLRDSTNKASKILNSILNKAEKKKSFFKLLGLTATVFDTSIIDLMGYLVINGDYKSRTDLYRKEIVGYENSYRRGVTQQMINAMIINDDYSVNKDTFNNIDRVIEKGKKLIYSPKAIPNFHIPKNKLLLKPVKLSDEGIEEYEWILKLSKQKAFKNEIAKMNKMSEIVTTDEAIINAINDILCKEGVKQPLIFYVLNKTRDKLIENFDSKGIKYLEFNGKSHTFFSDNDNVSPVLIQYVSGATAFESKYSNTSIYIDLPSSAVDFEQSLGRNTRREQNVDVVKNYIIEPFGADENMPISFFTDKYDRIINKTKWNNKFLNIFSTEWGMLNENEEW